MFREEMKKLYFKQYGLILTVILIIGELITVNFLYPERSFSSEFTERQFYEYENQFSGELTPEKEAAILAEQENITNAQNAEKAIEEALFRGEYSSEEEFVAVYEEKQNITKRRDAFDIIFAQYSYALESPRDRYLTMGDYTGLGADIPDVLLLAAVILMTAGLFLNEEGSNVITFVRISENGKAKTLWGKIFSLLIFIFSCQIFRTLSELFVMASRGGLGELSYPVQSIEYFSNCPYDISILEVFLAISALRLLGNLFIASLVILLSVTLKKALFTVFIPSAVCLLQQFAFDPATPAYYIPTGFLRAVGYFRGEVITENGSGETVTQFGEVKSSHLTVLIIITLLFIVISVKTAYNYYSGNTRRTHKKVAAVLVLLLCLPLSGCSRKQNPDIVYNFCDGYFFAQNDKYYFVQNGNKITAYSKEDGTELDVLCDAFLSDDRKKTFMLYGDELYHTERSSRGDVYRFSLDTFGNDIAVPAVKNTQGFLGVELLKDVPIGFMVDGFFTNGSSNYYIYFYSRQVYTMKNGNYVQVLEDKIFNYNLAFDGEKIYYINSLMQLKCHDTLTGKEQRLPGEFVRTIYYDSTRLLYSDRNGIFSLNTSDLSTEKLSDVSTNQLTSDGKEIVYKDGDSLVLLDGDIPIYSDARSSNFTKFAVISDVGKFVIQNGVGDCKLLDLPDGNTY